MTISVARKFHKGAFLRNQPLCGDTAKLVDKLDRSNLTYFASIKGFIQKIVTWTEILAPVSLQLDTNFKQGRPAGSSMF